MRVLSNTTLSGRLAMLVLLASVPALVILLYSGLEDRRISIASARQEVFQQTNVMAHLWQDSIDSARNTLSTLSQVPCVNSWDVTVCSEIFKRVLNENPNYKNFALANLDGDVIASGRKFAQTNMADRTDFREVLEHEAFAVGEYIVPRIGSTHPVLTFAHPVFDSDGALIAVLSTALELNSFSGFHDSLNLPERSFISITDRQGIRLFYHPAQPETNPVGKQIKAKSWEVARNAQGPGYMTGAGSDGHKRIFSYRQLRLRPGDPPYLYVWAGIPEAAIVGPANAKLARNLLLMLIVILVSFAISRVIGRQTEALISKLEDASEEINTLRGIIPICSMCKNIRNDDGYYERIEDYIHEHSGADFTHTICPACLKAHYPEEYQDILSE